MIWRRDDEPLRKFKSRKTCGDYFCRYKKAQGQPVYDTTPHKLLVAYKDRPKKEPEPRFPVIEEVEWSIRPNFSKYNVKEKPSAMFRMMKPETFVFREE